MCKFQFNDGGRKEAGYLGDTGDCAVRSVSIVTGLPYQEVYDEINRLAKTKKGKKVSNSRTGVWNDHLKEFMSSLGWKWIPTMLIGKGCKVHLKSDELPQGKIICRVSKHFTAVVDGVINDTFDCSRGGSRCVYGYYIKD